MVSRKMSFRSALASASSTLLACSTSSSPSGYLRWISSVRPARSFSASSTFPGSPEMRKTFPRCPIWTPNLCSISLRFSLRPPASVRAPSLSSSSSRAEGSANDTSSKVGDIQWRPQVCTADLIKRRQQDKPLLGPAVVIRLFPWVPEIVLRDELSLDQGAERRRVFTVLGPVQFERALQPGHLIARDQACHRAAPGRGIPPRRAETRRHHPHQDQGGAEERQRERQPDERLGPGDRGPPSLPQAFGQSRSAARRWDELQVFPLDQLLQRFERLELPHPGGVRDLLYGLDRQRELVDELVAGGGLALIALAVLEDLAGGGQIPDLQLLEPFEGGRAPRDLLLEGRPLVHPPEALEEDALGPDGVEGALGRVHVLLRELVGAVLPGEELVEGLRGLQPHHLREPSLRHRAALDQDVAQALERALLRGERFVELVLADQLRAQQQAAEKVLGIARLLTGEHDVAFDEEHLHLVRAGLQRQPPGLGLVSDQLQDVGDAKVLERPREGHYAPSSAAWRASRSRRQIAYTPIRTADVNPTRAKEMPLFTASGSCATPRQNTMLARSDAVAAMKTKPRMGYPIITWPAPESRAKTRASKRLRRW